MTKKLIFIYNADSGVGNAISDSIHKFISPETYPCDLCALTHGYFGEKKQRTAFLKSLTIPVVCYHKDELASLPYILPSLPCILIVDETKLLWSLAGEERNTLTSLDDLIKKLKEVVDHITKKHRYKKIRL